MTGQPWHGETVSFTVEGEPVEAHYNPGEMLMMKIARERGATRHELEVLHLLKALLDATIIDAQTAA